jgi:hypothetical protein
MPTFLPGPRFPVPQRRIGGNARAQQRRNGSEVKVRGHGMREPLIDRVVARVAAHGDGAVHAIRCGVGQRRAFIAKMLFALFARRARAAGVDNHADSRNIAHFEFAHRVARSRYSPDDFVARHHRVHRLSPLVARHVQVGMANAAEENVDGNFARAWFTAREIVGRERGLRIESCITF